MTKPEISVTLTEQLQCSMCTNTYKSVSLESMTIEEGEGII